MDYLVLGCNSFAGASFVDYLLNQQQSVIGINRSAYLHKTLVAYGNNAHLAKFTFHQLDVNQHFEEIARLIQKQKPKVIVDFAGQGMVAESWQNPEQWYQTNIVAKVKLHNILRHCDFLDRYVRVSTPEVYGHTPSLIAENGAFAPSTPYAVSHAAIDMSLLAFYRQYQFPVVLTRFANFYGPHQQLYRIIPRTIIYALTGQRLQLHGGGESKRAFIHGYDVASGIEAAIKKGSCGETYHFSAGEVISIANLVRSICELMNIDYEHFIDIVPDRPAKDSQYFMCRDKAKNQLQWQPSITLQQGLDQTISWIRQNLDVIKSSPLNYIHKI